jgi:Tol biopolymer transport system component
MSRTRLPSSFVSALRASRRAGRPRRLSVALSLALVLLLTLFVRSALAGPAMDWLAGLGPPSASHPTARLAFLRQGDVWLLDLPAGRETRLTTDGASQWLRWGANGRSLFFGASRPGSPTQRWQSGRGVETVAAGVWSPDGGARAFSEATDSGSRASAVWVEEGGRLAQISPADPGARWTALAWSPDGRRLALSRIEAPPSQQPGQPIPPSAGSLWVTEGDALAGQLRQLPLPPDFQGNPGWPDLVIWSPDGRYLVVGVGPDQPCGSCRADGLPYAAIPVDGGKPLPLGSALAPAEALSWAPDGSFVVLSGPLGRETYVDKDLTRIDLPSGIRRDLAPEANWADVEPAVSPDGKTVAFARGRAQPPGSGAIATGPEDSPSNLIASRRIWLVDANGAHPRQLTDAAGWTDEAPVWTPDGAWIIFVRWRAKPAPAAEVWAVRPDGSGLQRLVAGLDLPPGFGDGFGYYGSFGWRQLLGIG